jgi:hypothetical protein
LAGSCPKNNRDSISYANIAATNSQIDWGNLMDNQDLETELMDMQVEEDRPNKQKTNDEGKRRNEESKEASFEDIEKNGSVKNLENVQVEQTQKKESKQIENKQDQMEDQESDADKMITEENSDKDEEDENILLIKRNI